MFFPERVRSIDAADQVLEIGPGGTPHPRADLFLEKRFRSRDEEIGQRGHAPALEDDRKVVYFEGGRFPFSDKEFDYVICSHVLEHVEDVDFFVSEVVRVARKGYFEYPTIYYDYLFDFPEHKTFLFCRDDVIRWIPKADTPFSEFKAVHTFFYEALKKGHNDIVDDLKPYLFQGFEWFGAVGTARVISLEDLAYRPDEIDIPPRESRRDEKNWLAPASSPAGGEGLPSWLAFIRDYRTFKKMANERGPRFPLRWKDRLACLNDKTPITGFDRHYVYHTAWAARVLARTRPASHVDISSSLYFCSIVSAFVPIRYYDYRPANLHLSGLSMGSVDLLALPFGNGEIASLSCMHVVEHVGLGRYGDPLDPEGDRIAIEELKRVLAPGGLLLFVIPIGQPKIMFNAHRIYSYSQIEEYFHDLAIEEFALIPDAPGAGGLIQHAPRDLADAQRYGCGCFLFRRSTK